MVQSLMKNSVGKKIIMALTGQIMLLFVIIHMIGNATIYFSQLNAYAAQLHALSSLVWANRLVMLILFSLHVFIGINLYLENREAKPEPYAVKKSLRATFAGKTMIWTGLLIGVFVIYHLLHFTIQVTNPEISASMKSDELGRPDVFRMVVLSFQKFIISFIYIIAMSALLLHSTHGIQSSFQSVGLNNERTMPVIIKTGSILAYILFIGFVSIPIIIFIGLMKG
jgi:succinate dehydrogenase / fumarate reductase cytochrome b subunit